MSPSPHSSHTPCLHRLQHVFARDPLYFHTFCTHARRPHFLAPSLHSAFLSFARESTAHGLSVGRYVLMPDHAHFFLRQSRDVIPLSAWMKSLKNSLSKNLRLAGIPSPHWQKGFFDHLLRSADSYSEKWDYVRANPVRAGLVLRPEDWQLQGAIHDLEF